MLFDVKLNLVRSLTISELPVKHFPSTLVLAAVAAAVAAAVKHFPSAGSSCCGTVMGLTNTETLKTLGISVLVSSDKKNENGRKRS